MTAAGDREPMQQPKSAARAVTLVSAIADNLATLRQTHAHLLALAGDVATAIEDAEHLRAAVEALESPTDDAAERARLKVFRASGDIVIRAADSHAADLRDVLGPGGPRTASGLAARRAAIVGLAAAGVRPYDIATILRISYDVVRRGRMAA